MILPGLATGMAKVKPASGSRAEAGAFLAISARAFMSPLARRKAPSSPGSEASTACTSMTVAPSTIPMRMPLLVWKLTIFMVVLSRLNNAARPDAAGGRMT